MYRNRAGRGKHEEGLTTWNFRVEYTRKDGTIVQKLVDDFTGEKFMFFIKAGDILTVYESKNKPHRQYYPSAHFASRTLIFFSLVFVSFFFMIFWGISDKSQYRY